MIRPRTTTSSAARKPSFLTNATLDVFDYSNFTNNGAGVTWTRSTRVGPTTTP